MKPLISIIIPVYNVEQYLERCLDSCVNQTLRDIEVIAVNDCSPDGCAEIMRRYEKKYPDKVRCIYLDKSLKPGGARNCGLKVARGDYIMFVDSDDWISTNACEKLHNSAVYNNADVVAFSYQVAYDNGENRIVSCGEIDLYDIDLKNIYGGDKPSFLWNKMYKKELIMDSGCFFPENCFFEDLAVLGAWLSKATVINYINKSLYYYYSREGSFLHRVPTIQDRIQYFEGVITLINNLLKIRSKDCDEVWMTIFNRIYKIIIEFSQNYIHFGKENLEKHKEKLFELVPNIEDYLMRIDMNEYQKKIVISFLKTKGYIDLLCNSERFKNRKICMWGNGACGRGILLYFKQCDYVPEYIIDSNQNLHGTYVDDKIRIVSFDDIKDKCQEIVITIKNEQVMEEIKYMINTTNPNIDVKNYMDLFIL